MSSICWECKYDHSDCKGEKWVEKAKCDYFIKKDAINYPQKVRELENEIKGLELQIDLGAELCEVFRKDNSRLKAENEKYKEHIKSLDDIILKLKE